MDSIVDGSAYEAHQEYRLSGLDDDDPDPRRNPRGPGSVADRRTKNRRYGSKGKS